jgi:membrane-associated phospholipid phosphatase
MADSATHPPALNLHRRHVSSDQMSLLDTPRPETKPHETQSQHPILRALERLDQELSLPIHRCSPGRWADWLIVIPGLWFSDFGVPLWLVLSFFFAPIRFFALVLSGTLVTLFFSNSLKVVAGRRRPGAHVMGHRIVDLRTRERNNAMPSGDTAQSAAWTSIFLWYMSASPSSALFGLAPPFPWLWLVLAVPPLTAFGRVYYSCHWVGDTIAGAALGATVGTAVWHSAQHLCVVAPDVMGSFCFAK